jgi:phospholipid/cholesterol/gamma-HCH transport system substrate-binding protein
MCPTKQAHCKPIVRRDIHFKVVRGHRRPEITSHGLRIERINVVNREYMHAVIGAGVIALAALFIVTAYSERGVGLSSGYELKARFGSIDGIKNGSDVLLAGVPVGNVSRVDFIPQSHQAILTLRLNFDVRLPKDTVAMVLSEGMLGSKYLKLEPGGDLDMLQPGDEFEYVQDSVIFEELLQKVILGAEAKRLKDRESAGK